MSISTLAELVGYSLLFLLLAIPILIIGYFNTKTYVYTNIRFKEAKDHSDHSVLIFNWQKKIFGRRIGRAHESVYSNAYFSVNWFHLYGSFMPKDWNGNTPMDLEGLKYRWSKEREEKKKAKA